MNNAGINIEHGPLTEGTEAEWDRVLSINLKGVMLCMQYAIHAMLADSGGAIVNNASVVGLTGGRGFPAYVASKHAIIGLTKAAALDYAKDGIRVNAVCPGTINTPMYEHRVGTDPQTAARISSEIPLERLGQPEDVAEAVIWLCSPAASFVTGHSSLGRRRRYRLGRNSYETVCARVLFHPLNHPRRVMRAHLFPAYTAERNQRCSSHASQKEGGHQAAHHWMEETQSFFVR